MSDPPRIRQAPPEFWQICCLACRATLQVEVAMAVTNESPLLTARFDDALVYASHLHRRQLRKGTSVPYVAHLLGVAALVLEDGGDEDEAIAALLHDAVEDQGGAETRDE